MTIFEKTMQACREENAKKKVVEKKSTKKTTKNTSRKPISEKRTRKFEADDDFDFEDDGFGDEFADDEEGAPIDGDAEFEGDSDDYAPDIEDDISFKPEDDVATVVDTDVEDDDSFLADALKALQQVNDENIEVAEDAIEEAGEDEEASTEDYVGQNVYICPICGSTFFNDGELADGDACPVCGETPEKFVACGTVEANDQTEDSGDEDEGEEDEDLDFEEEDTEEESDEEESDEDKVEDEEEDDEDKEAKEEAYRRRRAAMRRRNEARRRADNRRPVSEFKSSYSKKDSKDISLINLYYNTLRDNINFKKYDLKDLGGEEKVARAYAQWWLETKCDNFEVPKDKKALKALVKDVKDKIKQDTGVDSKFVQKYSKKSNTSESKRTYKTPNLYLNEKTFERHLCKFFAENYSNVDDVTIKAAIIKEGKLGVGATLTFKSGKKKNVPFVVENFNMKSGVYSVKDTKNAFEAKTNNNPFKFKIRVENNIVSCEGMGYRYETRYEGKRVLVSGSTLTESKKKRVNNMSRRFEADKKDDKKTDKKDDKKTDKKGAKKGSGDLNLDDDQIKKICAILDYWTFDIEEDGGRDTSDMDERNIRYTKADKEKAAKLGKLCPPMNINGGMSETTCVNFLKKERRDLYDAIANCDDKNERQRIFRQIRTAAEDGDFKKKF